MFFHSLYGYNLLLVACNRPPNAGTLTTIRLLLEVGADANVTDNKGNSPLHHVVRWTREAPEYVSPIATLLLKHGALPHQRNSSNETPLDLWTMHNARPGTTLYPPTWTLTTVMPLAWWSVRSIRQNKTCYKKLPVPLIRKYFPRKR